MIKVELEKFLPEKLRYIGGEDLGYELRNTLNLNEVDSKDEQVEIVISKKYFGASQSFFYGLLYDSSEALSKEELQNKYKISSTNKDIIANFNEQLEKFYQIRELISKR